MSQRLLDDYVTPWLESSTCNQAHTHKEEREDISILRISDIAYQFVTNIFPYISIIYSHIFPYLDTGLIFSHLSARVTQ